MVFHRFLSGHVRGKRFKLLLNGNPIQPWDPFCRSEDKTKALSAVSISLEHEGVTGDVLLEPFILPHQDDFSSLDAFRLASGPANWNQQQGFYIYRAGRMIQSGGWSNLRAPDEHTKLARVAVSFPPKLDEAFKINVAKMRVQIPPQIRDEVREVIGRVVKLAREVYDRRPPAPESQTLGTTAIAAQGIPAFAQSRNLQHGLRLTWDEWAHRTLGAANRQERPVVEAVLERVRKITQHRQRANLGRR
jgi:hypothetical protein